MNMLHESGENRIKYIYTRMAYIDSPSNNSKQQWENEN